MVDFTYIRICIRQRKTGSARSLITDFSILFGFSKSLIPQGICHSRLGKMTCTNSVFISDKEVLEKIPYGS
jgi:hypothetical protein